MRFCLALRAARLSSWKDLGELISKRRGLRRSAGLFWCQALVCLTCACGSVAEKVLKVSAGGRIFLWSDRGASSFHSVSDSPDNDLPPGKHIVWGDEAKPPVFGHWPTALLYGPRTACIRPTRATVGTILAYSGVRPPAPRWGALWKLPLTFKAPDSSWWAREKYDKAFLSMIYLSGEGGPQWVRHCSDWLSSWYWIFARTVWSDANRPVHRAITRSFFLVLSFSILARSCEAMILAFKGAEYAAD